MSAHSRCLLGPVVRISPHEVDVLDVPAAKEIHSVKATYAKAPWYRTFATPGTENVFSTTDIEFHRRHRRLLQGPLSETNLKVFHPVVEQRVDLAIQRMKEETKIRGATDVLKWFLFLATDTVGELTFGESFRTLESGEVGLVKPLSRNHVGDLTTSRKMSIPRTWRLISEPAPREPRFP